MNQINPYEPPREESYAVERADDLYKLACLASEETPYPPEAYLFLLDGFAFAQQHVRHRRKGDKDVDGVDLCWCLHDLAVHRFGERARDHLASWKIRTTRDFGALVYRMIEIGQMRAEEGESIDDFDNVFDFFEQFDPREFSSTIEIDEDE